jgi:hypothetical protein
MEYRLIQHKDTALEKFNKEVNKLLKEGWELHGDYRITVIDPTESSPGFIINSQLLQRDDEKPSMGFK